MENRNENDLTKCYATTEKLLGRLLAAPTNPIREERLPRWKIRTQSLNVHLASPARNLAGRPIRIFVFCSEWSQVLSFFGSTIEVRDNCRENGGGVEFLDPARPLPQQASPRKSPSFQDLLDGAVPTIVVNNFFLLLCLLLNESSSISLPTSTIMGCHPLRDQNLRLRIEVEVPIRPRRLK
jgi:hypothetical protein